MEDNLSGVLAIVRTVGGLEQLDPDQDFYDAGFTSVNALPLLLEMEDRFQLQIPDDRFIQARTARQLCDLIGELL